MKRKGLRDVFVARAPRIFLSRAMRNAIVYSGRLVRRGIIIAHREATTTRRRRPTVVVSNKFSAISSYNFERLIPDASHASRIVQVRRWSNGSGPCVCVNSGKLISRLLPPVSGYTYGRQSLISIAATRAAISIDIKEQKGRASFRAEVLSS